MNTYSVFYHHGNIQTLALYALLVTLIPSIVLDQQHRSPFCHFMKNFIILLCFFTLGACNSVDPKQVAKLEQEAQAIGWNLKVPQPYEQEAVVNFKQKLKLTQSLHPKALNLHKRAKAIELNLKLKPPYTTQMILDAEQVLKRQEDLQKKSADLIKRANTIGWKLEIDRPLQAAKLKQLAAQVKNSETLHPKVIAMRKRAILVHMNPKTTKAPYDQKNLEQDIANLVIKELTTRLNSWHQTRVDRATNKTVIDEFYSATQDNLHDPCEISLKMSATCENCSWTEIESTARFTITELRFSSVYELESWQAPGGPLYGIVISKKTGTFTSFSVQKGKKISTVEIFGLTLPYEEEEHQTSSKKQAEGIYFYTPQKKNAQILRQTFVHAQKSCTPSGNLLSLIKED